MISVEKCPICSGEIVIKEVDKLLRGGKHTAILKVSAEVCLSCGEGLYSVETVRKFAKIRQQLQREETQEFQAMGQSFRVG
jgi:YgiT-type zinc finger domain-containing protein